MFIAVSAGASTALFQMESLATIVPEQPRNIPGKAPVARRGPESGAQSAVPPGVRAVLFAVPQGDLLDVPVVSQSACSDARQDAVSSTDSSSDATGTPGAGDGASRSCESASELPHAEAQAPRSPTKPAKPPADPTERDHGGAAQQPTESASANAPSSNKFSAQRLANDPSANDPSVNNSSVNSPTSKLLEDKRSCRLRRAKAEFSLERCSEGYRKDRLPGLGKPGRARRASSHSPVSPLATSSSQPTDRPSR